ncbi:MAG: malonyl-CoA synthase [Pseudomonadota bacterium]
MSTANPLYDAFIRPRREDARVFLHLPGGESVTYAQAMARAHQLAHVLVAKGVGPGDRVAVQVQKSPEALYLYLACVATGGVFLPLNTAYTAAELDYFIGDAEPALVVCDPSTRENLAAIADRYGAALTTLAPDGSGALTDAAATQPEVFDPVARGEDDLAAVLYTSGTTGRSKGAMLSQANLLSNAQALTDVWRFTDTDVLLHGLPIFHTHGLFVATNVTLSAGGSMIFLPKFDLDAMIEAMSRATTMMGVPTFYTRLLGDPRFTRDLVQHMRLFISGSAPLLAQTHVDFEERTGHRILERYGMSETGMITSNPYDAERRAGTVGFPLPGVAIRVVDRETGATVAHGETGVVEVKGPNVFKGYWRMPQKTKAEFRADGFFITGDLASQDADGYLTIVGRAKDLVITGGYNVYPKEIETAIDALEGVGESAVIGLPHPDFGEGVAAVVTRTHEAQLSEADVVGGVADKLAKFKQPKRVFFVDALPRNAMGKVQKQVLRTEYAGAFAPKPG